MSHAEDLAIGARKLSGGCHCGQVKFVMQAIEPLAVKECNCSICQAVGFLHLFVSKANFELLTDWDNLSLYTFNSGVARHWFCKTCGVKAFYRPRSHPTGYSVNARCLDGVELEDLQISPFDGRNWEANVGELAPL